MRTVKFYNIWPQKKITISFKDSVNDQTSILDHRGYKVDKVHIPQRSKDLGPCEAHNHEVMEHGQNGHSYRWLQQLDQLHLKPPFEKRVEVAVPRKPSDPIWEVIPHITLDSLDVCVSISFETIDSWTFFLVSFPSAKGNVLGTDHISNVLCPALGDNISTFRASNATVTAHLRKWRMANDSPHETNQAVKPASNGYFLGVSHLIAARA